jgi:DNA repair and recombination protein RAD54B
MPCHDDADAAGLLLATALLSFACPSILGSPSVFRRVYGDPITRSRDKDASAADKELGAARAG